MKKGSERSFSDTKFAHDKQKHNSINYKLQLVNNKIKPKMIKKIVNTQETTSERQNRPDNVYFDNLKMILRVFINIKKDLEEYLRKYTKDVI